MPTNLPAWPGTISIAAGSTAIIGTDAALTTVGQGALITVKGLTGKLAADPTDDNHATLLEPISDTAITNAAYDLTAISGAVVQAQRVRTTVETLAALPTTAGQIAAATETALADADESGWYQAASGNLIKRTWANVKSQLVAVYTTLTTASQAQAQAGTDNTTGMTPLRTAQAIVAQALRLSGGTLTGQLAIAADAVPPPSSDLNAVTSTGLTYADSTVANRPTSTGAGADITVLTQRRTSTVFTQIGVSWIDGSVYTRVSNGGSWSAWTNLYSRANLVGTASQSGGLPTGAAIETGTNANGTYAKFADGTLLCHTAQSQSTAMNIASGAGYIAGSYAWTFPAAFVSTPEMPSGGVTRPSGGAWGIILNYAAVSSTACSYVFYGAVSDSTTRTWVAQMLAIGRWY